MGKGLRSPSIASVKGVPAGLALKGLQEGLDRLSRYEDHNAECSNTISEWVDVVGKLQGFQRYRITSREEWEVVSGR